MISAKKRKVAEELGREIEAYFPYTRFVGLWDKGDGSIGVKILLPRSRSVSKITRYFLDRFVELWEKGYDIFVLPQDMRSDGRKKTAAEANKEHAKA